MMRSGAIALWMVSALLASGVAFAEVGDSYLKQGNTFYHSGQWDKAIAQYKIALAINPDHLGAMHNLGLAYQSKKDFARAIKIFRKMKEDDRFYVPAYISLGLVYTQQGRYKDAEREYRKAAALEPNNLIPPLNLAAVMAKQGFYAGAARATKRGLAIEPGSPHFQLLLAKVKAAQQKHKEKKKSHENVSSKL